MIKLQHVAQPVAAAARLSARRLTRGHFQPPTHPPALCMQAPTCNSATVLNNIMGASTTGCVTAECGWALSKVPVTVALHINVSGRWRAGGPGRAWRTNCAWGVCCLLCSHTLPTWRQLAPETPNLHPRPLSSPTCRAAPPK